MNIEWKEINPDYIVSSDGQIGSRRRGGLKMLRPGHTGSGYLYVTICSDGGQHNRLIHILVAEAFLGPRPTALHQVNHKNGAKADNHDTNLEWVTPSGNHRHRFDVLGQKAAHGEALSQTKLTEGRVREILVRCAAGETQRKVAADYGISQSAISSIVRRKNWAWIDNWGAANSTGRTAA